jgi:small-conductance mechanosensitive channel
MKGGGQRSNLGHWLVLLAGPLVWATHFFIVSLAVGWGASLGEEGKESARIVVAVATALALGTLAWLIVEARRARHDHWGGAKDLSRFWGWAGRVQLWFAIVAVVWQALPAVLVP